MDVWTAAAVTMVHTLWVGAVVGVAAMASRLVLGRAPVGVRYGVALGWLGVLAVTPVGVWGYVAREVGEGGPRGGLVSRAEESGVALRSQSSLRPTPAWDGAPARSDARAVEKPVVRVEGRSWDGVGEWRGALRVLPGIWLVGSAAMLGWSLLGLAGAERLRRVSCAVDAEVGAMARRLAARVGVAGVDVMACARVAVPVVVGVVRPAILLPPAVLAGVSGRELEMLLVHELAHVRRWDNAVNLAQRVVESALFYQPAVWVISAWVRQEREHCCDDAVLAEFGGERCAYARLLVGVGELCGPRAAGVASAAAGGNLVARVRRILTREDSMRVSRAWVAALVLAATAGGVWVARAAGGPAGAGKVVTVEKHGGDFQSIQKAIDAAPEGATVRIGAGEWVEQVTVKKPLTLEGAGWQKTTIALTVSQDARDAVKDLGERVEKQRINNGEWIARSKEIASKFSLRPVVSVEGAAGVNLRGLKVLGASAPYWNGSPMTAMSLVSYVGSSGEIKDCAVVGSPGEGIVVANKSDVRIDHCLSGGHWGTGVAVGGGNEPKPAKVAISNSDLRVCYYAGATIGPGCEATIERCRIWGAAWHGIRYDDCSPTIRGNMIYGIARLNLYGAGKTRATVSDNVIEASEMSGVWCLTGNCDRIVENTFINNTQSGIQVTGDSAPVIERNLFFYQPVAISCGREGSKADALVGHPTVRDNWVWPDPKVATPLQPGVDATTHVEDPGLSFADGNADLPANSPARAAHVGSGDHARVKSDFELQPQELAIKPEKADWDYQLWKKD